MNLKDIKLNEINHKKPNTGGFHSQEGLGVVKNHKDRKYNGGCQGLEPGENEGLLFNKYRVSDLQYDKGLGNGC